MFCPRLAIKQFNNFFSFHLRIYFSRVDHYRNMNHPWHLYGLTVNNWEHFAFAHFVQSLPTKRKWLFSLIEVDVRKRQTNCSHSFQMFEHIFCDFILFFGSCVLVGWLSWILAMKIDPQNQVVPFRSVLLLKCGGYFAEIAFENWFLVNVKWIIKHWKTKILFWFGCDSIFAMNKWRQTQSSTGIL